ncbi:hypothetical protein [Chroococcidiopsis sp. TS-821]|uniref:hypothetical protein n=1 Tax=Chroococcidiopsis sp. TS-821 TaxID=1378066 RepID=UPI00143DBAF6|nr:hypothetical protein [Chroococcidiopsis sp. TS-821]
MKAALQSVAQKLIETKIIVEKWIPFALFAYISPHQQPFNLDFARDSSSLM